MEHKRTVTLPYLCNLPFPFYNCGTASNPTIKCVIPQMQTMLVEYLPTTGLFWGQMLVNIPCGADGSHLSIPN